MRLSGHCRAMSAALSHDGIAIKRIYKSHPTINPLLIIVVMGDLCSMQRLPSLMAAIGSKCNAIASHPDVDRHDTRRPATALIESGLRLVHR